MTIQIGPTPPRDVLLDKLHELVSQLSDGALELLIARGLQILEPEVEAKPAETKELLDLIKRLRERLNRACANLLKLQEQCSHEGRVRVGDSDVTCCSDCGKLALD